MDIFLRPENFLTIPCCTSEELFLVYVVYVIVMQNKIYMQCIFISQAAFKNLVTKQIYLRLNY